MRRTVVWLALVFLLAGCSWPMPWSYGPPTCEPAGEGSFPAVRAKGRMRHSSLSKGDPLPGPGAYFLDLGTGEVEAWQPSGSIIPRNATAADPSWLQAEADGNQFLIRREDGAAFCWPRGSLRLVAAGPEALLFEGAGGSLTLTDRDLKPRQTLSLSSGATAEALFSPDGKQIAVNPWRYAVPPAGSPMLYLVDAATGEVKPAEGPALGATEEVVLHAGPSLGIRLGGEDQFLMRRYGWDGALLGEWAVDSTSLSLSPGGDRAAAEVDLNGFSKAVVVYDTATGGRLFRVLGVHSPAWVADGSALLVRDGGGRSWEVTPQGKLTPSPLQAVADGYLKSLLPSPADPNWFLVADVMAGGQSGGLQVADASGQVLHALSAGDQELYLRGGWVPSGEEVALSLWEGGGKDYGQPGFYLEPAVEAPVSGDPFFLQVLDEAGDCLNLRQRPTTESAILRCLPTGTRLAIGDLSALGEELDSPLQVPDPAAPEAAWLLVRTEQEETGWVALYTGIVTWAAAR